MLYEELQNVLCFKSMTLYMSGMLHVCHNIFLGFTERLTIALKFTFSKQAL